MPCPFGVWGIAIVMERDEIGDDEFGLEWDGDGDFLRCFTGAGRSCYT